jgi:hypothetical protein
MRELSIDNRATGFMRWAGPLVIAVAGIVMLVATWRKWPDVLIDFGQQLYLAWQMAEGRSLYSDLVCNYGPLAAYLNAWVFQLFGGHMMALVGLNLAVFVAMAILLYRVLLVIGTPLSATVSGLLLMLVFGFSQLTLAGNFNFATPYENSLTVGMLAALAAVCCGLRYVEKATPRRAVATGVCLGLAFLTKPEVFLAGAAGVVVAWIAMARTACWSGAQFRGAFGVALAGCLIPLLISVLTLATAMPFGTAVAGSLGSWSALLGSSTSDLLFYRSGMGTDDLLGNLGRMLAVSAVWSVLAGCAILAGRLGRGSKGPAAGLLLALLVLGGLWVVVPLPLWQAAVRPLPLAMLWFAGLAVAALRRAVGDQAAIMVAVARLSIAVFAGVLLLKMALNARVGHYGFALAMPATLLVSTAMMAWLPSWVARRGGCGVRTAGVCGGILAAFVAVTIYKSNALLADKTIPIGSGADRFLADGRGEYVKPALAAIAKLPGDTMAVFPEGSILNYLTRRANPTPFYNYMPTGFSIFGETPILQSLQQAPPDVVVMVEKDTSEFGFRYFGTDYGREIRKWLEQKYVIAHQLGEMPLSGQGFGILVLRRKQ